MATFTAAGLDHLDALVASAVDDGQVPGVVCALARSDEVHVVAAGDATVGGSPMARDTIVRIASLSKPITAAAALSLVADGHLGLDDPIDPWVPELADRRVLVRPDGPLDETVPAERTITLRDLLTSTMGFGMDGAMFTAADPWPIVAAAAALHTFGPPVPAETPDLDAWIALLGDLPLLAQPGAKYLYNTSSAVLGVVVHRVTGQPLGDVLRERVFAPLGMTDTAFSADPARLATAYRRRDGELQIADPPDGQWSRPPAFPDGGGGLVGTVDDLVEFGRMLLRDGGGVLPPPLAREMTRDQLTERQRANDWGGFSFLGDRSWGYGLSVQPDRCGWEGGSGTSWCNIPSLDLTVVTLTQREFDETGPPAVLEGVVAAAVAAVA